MKRDLGIGSGRWPISCRSFRLWVRATLRRSQKTQRLPDSWIRRVEDSIRSRNAQRPPVFGTGRGKRSQEAGRPARRRRVRCFTVSRENRSQLTLPDDSIFYVNRSSPFVWL